MYKQIIDKYFIHDNLKEVPYIHAKAKILVTMYLFVILFGFAMFSLGPLIGYEEDVPVLEGTFLVMLFIFFFRYNGNLVLAGNLLAVVLFTILLSAISTTGGIYSDNLLWMIVVPLIALLFASRNSGIFWTLALMGVTVYFYFEKKSEVNPTSQVLLFEVEYYLASYLSLFIAVICIVIIFEVGREGIIELLRSKNKELKDSKLQLEFQHNVLVEQTNALEVLSQNLKTSNADLENFAHAASHDLKQPLRVIQSFIKVLEKDEAITSKATNQKYMSFIVDSSNRMERLLTDLLSLSRIGRASPDCEKVNMNNVIAIVQDNLKERIHETNASIVYSNLPDIYAPSSLIIQLCQNLIANGIKFQKKDNTPQVKINATCTKDEVEISIADNGIGIADEYLEKIFEMFQRLNSQSEYEGSGIGLHTCQRIVESMGKKIWLTSEKDVGTTFYFTMPIYHEGIENEAPNVRTGEQISMINETYRLKTNKK